MRCRCTLRWHRLPYVDHLLATEAWTRLAVAVDGGDWQDGAATIRVRAGGGGTGTPLDMREVRVIVDRRSALVLDGEHLATLAD